MASAAKKSGGNSFMTGLMVGFLMGVMASLAVIVFIKSNDSPFAGESIAHETQLADKIAQDTQEAETVAKEKAKQYADMIKDKTNFDLFKVLTGKESKVSAIEEEAMVVSEDAVTESVAYFLQVGAYKSEQDADKLKAKLALQGVEARVQAADIPDKGVWYRVRVGPMDDNTEITRIRAKLARNGVTADLIKIAQ